VRGSRDDGLENAMALLGFFLSALLNAKGHHNLYERGWKTTEITMVF